MTCFLERSSKYGNDFLQVTVKKTGDDTKYIATVRNNPATTVANCSVQFWLMSDVFLFLGSIYWGRV
jgi:hypothetical protein